VKGFLGHCIAHLSVRRRIRLMALHGHKMGKPLPANPLITKGEAGRGGRRSDPWPLRPIRFHSEGAARRGEAPPRPYLLVAYPHVIDGLGLPLFA
jgi:hypothetical protein